MQSSSKDIATLLNGESALGITLGTDLFYGRMIPSPINQVAVLENPGRSPLLALIKMPKQYYRSSVSVMVRDSDYDDGYGLAHDILEFLHQYKGTINGTAYDIIAMNDVQLLHRDENDRPVFLINFECRRASV